jgi:hypothetical protein
MAQTPQAKLGMHDRAFRGNFTCVAQQSMPLDTGTIGRPCLIHPGRASQAPSPQGQYLYAYIRTGFLSFHFAGLPSATFWVPSWLRLLACFDLLP